jgi:hypothetical protein
LSSKGEAPPAESRLDRGVGWLGRSCSYLLPLCGSLIVIWLALPFLQGEQSRAWDDLFHQNMALTLAKKLDAGEGPFGVYPSMFGIPGARHYQFLHHMLVGLVTWITEFRVTLVHNWILALLFALTPWTYRYFLVRIGLSPLAAGFAGLLGIGSVYGWGNAFEAYYELGVVTQVLATVLLPLALAQVVRICQDGKGVVAMGVLLAATVMSHAAYAIYAVLACLLLVLAFAHSYRTLLKLAAGGVLAGVLVACWLVPFVQYRAEEKVPTDIVARPDRFVWSSAHSGASLFRALASGRVLDGGRKDDSADEQLDIKLNMTGTREVRFPYYSILALIGLVLALIRFRQPVQRVLIGGTVLGLLLYLGFDDFPFMYRMPILNQVQAFRVGWFVELFAVALAGQAVAWLLSAPYGLLRRKLAPRFAAIPIALPGICLVAAFAWDLERVVMPLLDTWDVKLFDKVDRVLRRAGAPDPEQRLLVKFGRPPSRQFRFALEHALEVRGDHISTCNHWTSISPTVNLKICGVLHRPERALEFTRMMGVRFLLIKKKQIAEINKQFSEPDNPYRVWGRMGRVYVVEDRQASMIHEPAGPRVLVVANSSQWYHLLGKWLRSYGAKVGDPRVPWLLRAPSQTLADPTVLDAVDAVMYLDDTNLEDDLAALKKVGESKLPLLLGLPIDGVEGQVMRPGSKPWGTLLRLGPRPAVGAEFKRLDEPGDMQRFAYRVVAPKSTVVYLSMQYFDGWRAEIDGEPAVVLDGGPDLVALVVPRGTHAVHFSFQLETDQLIVLVLSLVGWFGVLVVIGVTRGPGAVRGIRRLARRVLDLLGRRRRPPEERSSSKGLDSEKE